MTVVSAMALVAMDAYQVLLPNNATHRTFGQRTGLSHFLLLE
jgi:hypothetical protein